MIALASSRSFELGAAVMEEWPTIHSQLRSRDKADCGIVTDIGGFIDSYRGKRP
jgi:hypothetical protein